MGKRIVIFFLLLGFFPGLMAQTYYVSTSGSDRGKGSISQPFRTIVYAASVAQPGSSIQIAAGTYREQGQAFLKQGVSLIGSKHGDVIVIPSYDSTTKSHWREAWLMLMQQTPNLDSQVIRNIVFEGENVALRAIVSNGRNNLILDSSTIRNFTRGGIGLFDYYGDKIYRTGNIIRNSTIFNSTTKEFGTGGGVDMHYQDGLEIHDCILGNKTREVGNVINGIKGYHRNWKLYRNKLYRPEDGGTEWQFFVEIWKTYGGIEIYDNVFDGGGQALDFGGGPQINDGYEYGAHIHHNVFRRDSRLPTYRQSTGVTIEQSGQDFIIEHNTFKNIQTPLALSTAYIPDMHITNVVFRFNLVEGAGTNEALPSMPMISFNQRHTSDTQRNNWIEKVKIYNNTIVNSNVQSFFKFENWITAENSRISEISIYNNIISNSNVRKGIIHFTTRNDATETLIEDVSFVNNIVFNVRRSGVELGRTNMILFENGRSVDNVGFTKLNTVFTDPKLTIDYKLSPSSPVKTAGAFVHLRPTIEIENTGAIRLPVRK